MEVRCPRCGKDFVRLVRREGLAEIIASATPDVAKAYKELTGQN